MDGFEKPRVAHPPSAAPRAIPPIIFITAFADEMHMASRLTRWGAVDYNPRPGDNRRFLQTKGGACWVDLYRQRQQLEEQAEQQKRRAGQLQRLCRRGFWRSNSSRLVAGAAQDRRPTAPVNANRRASGNHAFFLPASAAPRPQERGPVGSFSGKVRGVGTTGP